MQKTEIHSSAILEPGAKIGSGCYVGPFSYIGPDVSIGDNCRVESHVVIVGNTTIGKGCHIFPFASLGHRPQDLKFKGEASQLIIGDNNMIREYVTMNPGTEGGGLKTTVGHNCLFMASTHVAHDCVVGDSVIMANNATLAGHVSVGDFAIIGGLSGVLQRVRIGSHAMIGGMSAVESDVIPYGSTIGDRAFLSGLNIIGLKRRNFSRDDIHTLRSAYRLLFSPEGTLSERVDDVISRFKDNELVMEIIDFIRSDTSRPLCQPSEISA
ncbi:MAG: acyl-ACP--UDP-N-acetylglucosamine O-acyltransferase [Alphaproteobacteria bacterium]|nr:acyl-ACP--UDP-N-acetylglucosamine O-acyltransferase [Alphaproteobacteria bacterium]